MKVTYSIFPLGDQALSFEIEGDVVDVSTHSLLVSMKCWIDENPFEGLKDTVLGYRSLTVVFDLFKLASRHSLLNASEFAKQKVLDAYAFASNLDAVHESRRVKIPVCYDRDFGPDLANIAALKNISPEDIIRLHTSGVYNVYLVGFLPGFPYLGFVNPQLEVPRLASPRPNVPKGSVGIAGKQTGIYPLDSPGGWQIIGRTPTKIFDPLKSPPVIAEVGDTVSFYPISKEEFYHLENSST